MRTFSNYCCPAHTTRQPANPKKNPPHTRIPPLSSPPGQWYESADGESSWTPPFYEGDGEAAGGEAFETDGPGGARLLPGWKRCSDDEGDVWYEHEDGTSTWEAPLA